MVRFRLLAGCALTAAVIVAPPAGAAQVTITRTAQDIPTITARDFRSAGHGIGWAMAQDNVCEMAEIFTTLAGERSLHFDKVANGLWSAGTPDNAQSDFYHRYVNQTAGIEKMFGRPPPAGPRPEALQAIDGFVGGYNAYLSRTGIARLPDARCRGRAWVRPITRLDIARRIYSLINRAGRALGAIGIVEAGPPSLGNFTFGSPPVLVGRLATEVARMPQQQGSNAVALGGDATSTGRGILIANPHWAWDGLDRFWQMHVNIPGRLHVSGATFLGLPIVLMGHNEHVAFTSTVSAARRAAVIRTPLVPGDPMRYTVDGRVHTIEAVPVTIQVRDKDGNVKPWTKRIYRTIYGPITNGMLGLPLLPWTFGDVYSVRDVAQDNARIINQFLAFDEARSVREFKAASDLYSANPWATETAADDSGEIYFGDGGAVPNISDAHAARCNTELGRTLWSLIGLAVLDGGRSDCDVPTDPDSAAPHVMPARLQPWLIRRDYATNSNEGPWLTNPQQPLEGFSRIFGPERTARYARTRLGLMMVRDRLARGRFSRQDAQDMLLNDRNLFGEQWAGDLAAFCRRTPVMMDLTFTITDVRAACDVIAGWDRTTNLDSKGAVFFLRFLDNVLAQLEVITATTGVEPPGFWRVPFDARRPVDTPAGLNTGSLLVPIALARTVNDFRWVGLPLDTTLRRSSYTPYGGRRTPLHGTTGSSSGFNAIDQRWINTGYSQGGGTPEFEGGTSFVMVTSFTGGCVDDRSLLLGSQRSGESGWPLATAQVELYAKKQWVDPPFCGGEVARAGVRSVTRLNAP